MPVITMQDIILLSRLGLVINFIQWIPIRYKMTQNLLQSRYLL